MVIINLRDFYPWYTQDEYIEIPHEVAAELFSDKRYEAAYWRRVYYNKAQYSLDAGDGIENEVCLSAPSPDDVIEHRQAVCCLCEALAILPEKQARRIVAHYIYGRSIADIAEAEGIARSSVYESIKRGLQTIKNLLKDSYE